MKLPVAFTKWRKCPMQQSITRLGIAPKVWGAAASKPLMMIVNLPPALAASPCNFSGILLACCFLCGLVATLTEGKKGSVDGAKKEVVPPS